MTELSTTELNRKVESVLSDFTQWLARYGETSRDHQTFFAGVIGRRAKRVYYHNQLLGTAAVAPMIFLEAFAPQPGGFSIIPHDSRSPTLITQWGSRFFFRPQARRNISRAPSIFCANYNKAGPRNSRNIAGVIL